MAARTWTQTSGNNWSTAANWDGGVTVPQAGDTVTFNNTSTANCTIDNLGAFNGSVTVASTYSGTITQGSGVTINLGAYSQAAGTFTCASNATCTWTTFSVTGGTFNQGGAFVCTTFGCTSTGVYVGSSATMTTTAVTFSNTANLTATSGLWTLNNGGFTKSNSPTWSANGGTMAVTGTSGATINAAGLALGTFTSINTTGQFVVSASTTVSLGANPTIAGWSTALNNTISGTLSWTGTLTATGNLQVSAGGTLDSGSAVSLTNGNLDVSASATIPNGLNVTLNVTSSTARGMLGGGKTYGTFVRMGSGVGALTVSGSNTFTVFQDNDGAVAHSILFTAGTTQTIGTFSVAGASGKLITMRSTTANTAWIVTTAAGAETADYVAIQDSTADASPTWTAGSHSVDLGGNTNWLFTSSGSSSGGGGRGRVRQ